MAPGLGALPPAAGPELAPPARVDAVDALEPLLAATAAARAARLRLGAAGVRVARLPVALLARSSLEARQRLPRAARDSRSAAQRDLLLFLKVLAGLGYGNDPRVAGGGRLRALRRARSPARSRRPTAGRRRSATSRRRAARRSATSSIVGSGAGGAVAATVLAEAGLEVLVLEAGPYLDRDSYPDEPLAALVALYRDGGLTVAEGRPAIPTPVGRAVGGTTVINSGTCFRTPEPVLERWARRARDRLGDRARRRLRRGRGDARRAPGRPRAMGRNGQLLREGAEALGRQPRARCAATPAAASSAAPARTAAGSTPSGRCTSPTCRGRSPPAPGSAPGSRRGGSPSTAGAPRGSTAGPASPTAPGAVARSASVPAAAVVLAGGAFGTPELLLRSGFVSPSGELGPQPAHPSGVLGRRALRRGGARLGGRHAELRGRRVGGPRAPARGDVHAARVRRPVAARHRRRAPGAPARLRPTSPRPGSTSPTAPRAASASARDGSLRITYQLTREDADRLVFGIARAAELFYAAGATRGLPADLGHPDILPRGRIADLEASPPPPRALRLEAFHPMGTARMDADPARGRGRARRRRPRRRGPLRRRRQPAAELDRGQPDDDHHRDGLAGGRASWPTA